MSNQEVTLFAKRLDKVTLRIKSACARVQRNYEDITLIAVSKTYSIESIQEAMNAGIQHFGENRVQEALTKIPFLSPQLNWHLIGHLQNNKAKIAAELFDYIHSVDSLALAQRLNKRAYELGKILKILIQVKLSPETTKSGIETSGVRLLFEKISEYPNLQIGGLMTIPPYFSNSELVRPYFQQLKRLQDYLVLKFPKTQKLFHLSMGMSSDFEIAIEEGATMIRVGTALFGERSATTPNL